MRRHWCVLILLLLLTGCDRDHRKASARNGPGGNSTAGPRPSLVERKRDFKTLLIRRTRDDDPPPEPPADLLRVVHYDSAVGPLPAYLSVTPKDGKRRPAIIWIHGGQCNSLGPVWEWRSRGNDQSGLAFQEAGIVMMYPALRGGSGGPGVQEGFLGEVDDVIAARDFLAKQDSVDPNRIYLGGLSTGGTMALLVAESTDKFRAIFCFG